VRHSNRTTALTKLVYRQERETEENGRLMHFEKVKERDLAVLGSSADDLGSRDLS
jgi:hypothetical protein